MHTPFVAHHSTRGNGACLYLHPTRTLYNSYTNRERYFTQRILDPACPITNSRDSPCGELPQLSIFSRLLFQEPRLGADPAVIVVLLPPAIPSTLSPTPPLFKLILLDSRQVYPLYPPSPAKSIGKPSSSSSCKSSLGLLSLLIVVVTVTAPGLIGIAGPLPVTSLRSSSDCAVATRDASAGVDGRMARRLSTKGWLCGLGWISRREIELFDDSDRDVPALSFEVTHWMTIAEKRTAERSVPGLSTANEIRLVLSLLQHIRQTQPGSPFNAMRTVKLLYPRGISHEQRRTENRTTYTMLLSSVQTEPTNVRNAIARSRMFAADRGMFRNE